MKLKQFEEKQKTLLELVWKFPNIHQKEIARKLNLSDRGVRELVHATRMNGKIELGGREFYLIADNEGYKVEEVNSARFMAWVDRFHSQIEQMNQILNSI